MPVVDGDFTEKELDMPVPRAVTRTTTPGNLKTMYPDDVVHDQTNKNIRVLSDFEEQGWATDEGGSFKINIATGFSDATGFRDEGDDAPEADYNRQEFAEFNFTEFLGTLRLSGRIIDCGGTFVNPVRFEYERMRTKMRLDYEKSFFVPESGLYATCDAAASRVSFTVSNGQLLTKHMRIDVLLISDGTINGVGVENVEITALSRDQTTGITTVTIASPGLTTSYGDIDTTYGIFRTNSYGKHPSGFPDIIATANPATGNYGLIDRTVTTEWQAVVSDNQNAVFNAEAVDYLIGEVSEESGMEPDFIYCHRYAFRDLMSQSVAMKRTGDVQHLDPWGTTIMIGGTRVIPVRFCPYDKAYAIKKSTWRRAHPKRRSDGSPLYGVWVEPATGMQRVINKNMYHALWVAYLQVVCVQPNANGVLNNIKWAPKGTI